MHADNSTRLALLLFPALVGHESLRHFEVAESTISSGRFPCNLEDFHVTCVKLLHCLLMAKYTVSVLSRFCTAARACCSSPAWNTTVSKPGK